MRNAAADIRNNTALVETTTAEHVRTQDEEEEEEEVEDDGTEADVEEEEEEEDASAPATTSSAPISSAGPTRLIAYTRLSLVDVDAACDSDDTARTDNSNAGGGDDNEYEEEEKEEDEEDDAYHAAICNGPSISAGSSPRISTLATRPFDLLLALLSVSAVAGTVMTDEVHV